MKEYHKIETVFERDPDTKYRTLKEGVFSNPEFEYLQYNEWIWTEKVNGTNIRVIWENNEISFKGKTDSSQMSTKLFNRLTEIFTWANFMKLYQDQDMCLYGEGYGAKIEKGGGNYRQDQDFVLFDVKIDMWWLRRESVENIAQLLSLNVVPIIGSGNLNEMVDQAKSGFNSRWGNFLAEGIVARPKIEMRSRSDKRIITKIKTKDWED